MGNSYSAFDNLDENGNSTPSSNWGKGCGLIVSILSLLVAILALLFGDNLLGRRNSEQISLTKVNSATAIINPLPKNPDDLLIINGLVWEYSINESKIYQPNPIKSEQLSNFNIEVTLKFEDEQNEFHGVIFRRQDDDQFYGFVITPLGEYKVFYKAGESENNLVGPIHSDSILTGKSQLNKLRVKAIGPKFEFFINDNLVTSLSEFNLPTGGIGLYTCTCNGSNNSAVSFYDLHLSLPPDD
jgi:hypothetical protein